MKIIVINGCGGAGKDLFVKFAQANFEEIYNLSTITYVKEVAQKCGWDGEKDERGRRLLSDLKDALTAYDNIPLKKVLEEINKILFSYEQFEQSTDNLIFFIHCREPKEIEYLSREFNARSLLILRPAAEKVFNNHADDDVLNYEYDFTYHNIHNKETMEKDVVNFINWIKKKKWCSFGEGLNVWDYKGEM